MPSYNHAPFIGEAITSVLHQTYQDFELLITDDCSSDNSAEIIREFKDPRIKFYENTENRGVCLTTNSLIERASGKYIALLNSDDLWEQNKLDIQVQFLERNPEYAVVFSHVKVIDQNGKLLNESELMRLFNLPNRTRFEWLNYFFYHGNCLCHPSMLIHRWVYDKIGLYNPWMASLPDFDMWVRLCLKFDLHILPERLVRFRILDGERNASGRNPENLVRFQFEYKLILSHFLRLLPEDYNRVFQQPLAKDIAFDLSLKALKQPQRFMQAWALETLYNGLMQKSFMTPAEFTQLTGKHDIFNVIDNRLHRLQLFVDTGNNYTEEGSLQEFFTVTGDMQVFEFDLSGFDNLEGLRLDPLDDSCVVELDKLVLQTVNGEIDLLPHIRTNARFKRDKTFYFDTDDPQFVLHQSYRISGKILGLTVHVRYAHTGRAALKALIEQCYTSRKATAPTVSLQNIWHRFKRKLLQLGDQH
jgi:glycosyltransferase involved in cell wall biosynthesis